MNKKAQKKDDKGQKIVSIMCGKSMKDILRQTLIIICAVIFISSCSTKKEIAGIKSISTNHLIREVEENQFNYEKLQARININYSDNGNKLGLKGQLRIQRDSVIWVSLSLKVGIEIGRILITDDSIKFINRNSKTYIAESLDIVKNLIPFEPSIRIIQDILTGNDSYVKDDKRYKLSGENDKYKLEYRNDDIAENIYVFPDNFRISGYEIEGINNNESIQLEYANFLSINKRLLPTKIIITHKSEKKISLEIDYSNINTAEDISFPFNIGNKFERVRIW